MALNIAETFTEVLDYERATKYYEEYLKYYGLVRDRRTAFVSNQLGIILC